MSHFSNSRFESQRNQRYQGSNRATLIMKRLFLGPVFLNHGQLSTMNTNVWTLKLLELYACIVKAPLVKNSRLHDTLSLSSPLWFFFVTAGCVSDVVSYCCC